MSHLYVLYEHATGYALFRVKEFEEVAMFLPQVEQSVQELNKFKGIVQLIAFAPFKTAVNALENMNSVTEGIVHVDLEVFLETNLPKVGKKEKLTLGVGDAKLGMTIQESYSIPCQHSGVVPEVLRGIRLHFAKLIQGLTEQSSSKAQLGLGHSYSRSKVKFNVNRIDNMIIQSISLLDQLDKDINTFAMRIREWYSYHFPELIKIVPENYNYARVARLIKNRKDLSESSLEQLEELLMDSGKAQAILEASRSSMGMDISPVDLINIEMFASRVVSLSDYRKELMEYLRGKMAEIAPNLATLIGETVGARLISQAGSLTNLAKYPASTVQILGAEKALFRALKTRGNTPKYGLIYHSTFIGRATVAHKGRISRYLANKCSLASRIDCFSDIPTNIFGQRLKDQVEERLKFYETGELPQKNIDVMKAAVEEASVVQAKIIKKRKKAAKKEKRLKEEASEGMELNTTADTTLNGDEDAVPKKKKKSKKEKQLGQELSLTEETFDGDEEPRKRKKAKKNRSLNETEESAGGLSFNTTGDETFNGDESLGGEAQSKKKKKKKKKIAQE